MLIGLMTIYNEASFVDYAIRSALPHVDHLIIIEGAYQETIKLGAAPTSQDGTLKILQKYQNFDKVTIRVGVNKISDKDQRNYGLEIAKKLCGSNGWLHIIDGDEVNPVINFQMIKALTKKMDLCKAKAAYFKSLTFVNDFEHYCEQEFPRLFKLEPDCAFTNDNYFRWGADTHFGPPNVIKCPNIRFFHYSFCKGNERFELKKKWWETRFRQPFHYSWELDKTGNIVDSSHIIRPFTGKHPEIMKGHPLNDSRKRV